MSVISQESINKRKAAYMVCYANATWSRHQAIMFGDVCDQKEQEAKMVTLGWAMSILCGYSPEGECKGSRTITYEEVCCAIKIADPCCVKTACAEDQQPQPSCDPAIDYTVIATVAVVDRTGIESGPPNEGDSYYVVSGDIPNVWEKNQVVTWNGTGWDSVTLPNDSVVFATETSSYWTVLDSANPGMLFPSVIAELVGAGGLYSITSAYPTVSANAGRDAELRGMINGAWVTLFLGPESALATPSNYLLGSTQVSNLVVIYKSGACQWESSVSATPPFGECGVISAIITPVADCGNDSFFIGVNIESLTGYPLGSIIPVVNGVEQAPATTAILGMNIIGNYGFTDSVRVRIQNAFDSECDYISEPVTHPNMPGIDHMVYEAVDASFQGSAVPGRSYLIVSDTESVANTWALNVGRIWTGTDFVTVAEGEVTFATGASGILGYWQMDGGQQVQVFSPAIVTYNTISLVYLADLGPTAAFVSGMDVLLTYSCAGGGTVDLYNGPVTAFEPVTFTPVCTAENVIVTTTYMPSCPISITSEIEPYTPDGDPDPEFSEGGLNAAVYAVHIDPDDKIVVGGLFTSYGATQANRFTRLNSDGTLDTAFNTSLGTGFNAGVRAFVREEFGSYLCVGDFTSFNGTAVGFIARINQDGTLDTDFNTAIGTGTNFGSHYIVDLGDGTYIITGIFGQFNGNVHAGILKIDSDGAVVPGFVGAYNGQGGLAVLDPSDGNVIIGRGFSALYNGVGFGGTGAGSSYMKINPATGAIVDSMLLGSKFNGYANPRPLLDGSQIVVGTFTSYNGVPANRIARINPGGAIDNTFSANVGSGFNEETTNAVLLPNGQVAICMIGTATLFNGEATREMVLISQNGVRDPHFNSSGDGFTGGRTLFVEQQSTGHLVSVGWFTSFNSLPRLRVARFI